MGGRPPVGQKSCSGNGSVVRCHAGPSAPDTVGHRHCREVEVEVEGAAAKRKTTAAKTTAPWGRRDGRRWKGTCVTGNWDRGGRFDGSSGSSDSGIFEPLAPNRTLRRVVGGLVLGEGGLLVAAAVFLAVELLVSTPTELPAAVALAMISLVVGTGLLVAGRAVLRADERVRVPVLVWQALQVAAGAPSLSTRWYVAVLLLGTAAVVGVGVLVPGVLRPDVRGFGRD